MEKTRFDHKGKTYRVDLIKNNGKKLFFLNPLNRNVRTQKVFRGDNVDDKIHEFLDKLEQLKINVKINKEKTVPNNMNINLSEMKTIDPIEVKNTIDLYLDDKTGNNIVLFGSTKTGKSTLMMHLYRKYWANTIAILCAENIQIGMYHDNTEKMVKTYSYDVCEQLIKTIHRIQRGTKNNYEFTIMLDDIVTRTNDPTLQKLIMVYRNSLINSIISVQYPYVVSKRCRANMTNMIFFRFYNPATVIEITKQFLPQFFRNLTDAERVDKYNAMTKDHQFIYYSPKTEKFSIHKLLI